MNRHIAQISQEKISYLSSPISEDNKRKFYSEIKIIKEKLIYRGCLFNYL